MKFRKLSALAISTLILGSLILNPAVSFAASAKTGQPCAKTGLTQTVTGKKFTCVKSGNKKVWDKGIQNIVFKSVCEIDPEVPKEWAAYQNFAKKTFGCARPYRFVDRTQPNTKPSVELTPVSDRNPIDKCRLPEQRNYNQVGHRANGWKFSGDLQIQVIPVEFSDFKAAASPEKEYGKYLTYIKDMFYKLSDGNTKITFRTPQEYLKTGVSLESFVIPGEIAKNNNRFRWKNIDTSSYQKSVYSAADASINFSGVDMAMVIVPLSVPAIYIPHNQTYRMDNVSTAEGTVKYNYLMPPATAVDDMSWFGAEPFLHLHE